MVSSLRALKIRFFRTQDLFPTRRLLAALAVLCFLFPVFLNCRYRDGVSITVMPGGKTVLNRIAILPFQEIIPEDNAAKMASCPLCGAVFNIDRSTASPITAVEGVFMEGLQGFNKLTIISPESASDVYRRVAASVKAPLPEILKQVGRELGADGLLVGYIFRYRERKGYPYSVEKPASVAFDVHLIRVSDGIVAWRGACDKTQSSLMENILQIASFYKRGGRWLTAKELTEEGVSEMLKTFPGIE